MIWPGLLCAGALLAESSTAARDAEIFGGAPDPRDSSLFGEEAPAAPAATSSVAPGAPTAAEREAAILGGGSGSSLALADQQMAEAEARLAIGGVLYLRADYALLDEQQVKRGSYDSPNLFDLYLDARPNDRVRGFVKGRLSFNPTVRTDTSGTLGGETDPANPSSAGTLTSGLGGARALAVNLSELWAKFDLERTLFVTLGRQPVKWGSGRVWNPTDFLQPAVKNPLDIFDLRTGVDLLKLHLPVESLGWNFYGVALFDGVREVRDVGGALRAELLLGDAEIALSGMARGGQPQRLGIDVSSPIGPIDAHAELALSSRSPLPLYRGTPSLRPLLRLPEPDPERTDALAMQLVLGADVMIQYSDQDSIILAAEYLYNPRGYDDPEFYPFLVALGAYRPFYLGQHYGVFSVFLQNPGSWNNTTFTMSTLGNLSDRSFITRLDYQLRALTFLRLNAYGMLHYGENGEFRLAIDIPPLPLPGLEAGFARAAPLFEVGVGATLDF